MTRACGDCQLCCKLLPVADALLQKGAGVRCKHQAHRVGCRVYGGGAMPPSCRLWNCAWLVEVEAQDLRRPDRSHYVVDILPDFVTLVDNDTGEPTNIPVVQVWIDPHHPEAHRDPALRAYLETKATAGLIRRNSRDAFLLIPPAVAGDGQWHEMTSNNAPRGQHTAEEIHKVLLGVD